MNRTTFLISYILLALFCCSPVNLLPNGFWMNILWSPYQVFSAFAVVGWNALRSPKIIVPIAITIALIIIARSRGRQIGRPWLFWLPVAALLLSMGRVAHPLSTLGPVLEILAVLGPLILHAVCVTLGAQNGDAQRQHCRIHLHPCLHQQQERGKS